MMSTEEHAITPSCRLSKSVEGYQFKHF